MTRLLLRLAAAACIAPLLSACGGGGSHAGLVPTSQTAPLQPDSVARAPQSAVAGVLVAVHLPLRNTDELDSLIQRQTDKSSADYHRFLTPQQFRARYGPTSADLSTAASTLRTQGFQTNVTSQGVFAAAPQSTVERTFNIHLKQTIEGGHSTLTPDRAVSLPAALAKVGATVGFGTKLAQVNSLRSAQPIADNRYSPVGPYWFTDLKQAYGYPSYQTANGQGRTIAIVIDSDILDSDLAFYFGHEKLAPPTVERRPVNGGPKEFDPGSGSSTEASLDVQQSFGSAPGAHIMLYGIPQLSQDNLTFAYSAIVDDNRADIVNMSFGLCELFFTAAYNGGVDFTSIVERNHDLFRQGNAQGITFVNSSGDSGAFQCVNPSGTEFIKGVQNPSDDTAVTSVGGTNLVTNTVVGGHDSSYVRESEFFDTFDKPIANDIWGPGGGISVLFAKPWYQNLVQTHANTRTIPDVALHMGGCPFGSRRPCNPDDSAVITAIGGQLFGVIGTSAASPDFAGLLAVTEQTLGSRLGNANGYVYTLAQALGSGAYRQNIPGNNGYPALNGYDYVTGLGTPIAAVFAGQATAPRAGEPQTPTNP